MNNPQILFPATDDARGFAFERLILSYYHHYTSEIVQEWSNWLHGTNGKWYQIDGIILDTAGKRWLLEAKFYKDSSVGVREIQPDRRADAARALNCQGIRYVSVGGFRADLLATAHNGLSVEFLEWNDLRKAILPVVPSTSTVLLDPMVLHHQHVGATNGEELHFQVTLNPQEVIMRFPEFQSVEDRYELWIRRLPRMRRWREHVCNGRFLYSDEYSTVTLLHDRDTDLSLREAWEIEDALSGYAARVYSSIAKTALALAHITQGAGSDVLAELQRRGETTGQAGVDDALRSLVFFGMVEKSRQDRKNFYRLTGLGRAYTSTGHPDDVLFNQQLQQWLPYRTLKQAIQLKGVRAASDDVIRYFKRQYVPYEPYARSLYNPNKTDGLMGLYRLFK